MILVQFGASLRATERAPPKRGFFFEAAPPRLVSGGRIEPSQRPVMGDVPSGDALARAQGKSPNVLLEVVSAWYVAASTSPPAGRLLRRR